MRRQCLLVDGPNEGKVVDALGAGIHMPHAFPAPNKTSPHMVVAIYKYEMMKGSWLTGRFDGWGRCNCGWSPEEISEEKVDAETATR